MSTWKFWDYCPSGSDGPNPIREWYVNQHDKVRAEFDVTVLTLRGTQDWDHPKVREFATLKRQHEGLGELRFHVHLFDPALGKETKRRFRPVGIWRPETTSFIFLLGCEKSGRIYKPPNAFDLALQYKNDFERGNGVICEHD